jgi:hypothetical protein
LIGSQALQMLASIWLTGSVASPMQQLLRPSTVGHWQVQIQISALL